MEAIIASRPGANRGLVNGATSLVRRVLLSDVPCLEGLTWKRVGWSFALATALALHTMVSDMSDWQGGHFAAPIQAYAQQFVHWFPKYVVSYVPLMLLATVADNVAERGAARVAAFGAALVLGVAAIPVEFCVFQLWIGPRCTMSWEYFVGTSTSTFILQFVPLSAIVGAVWLAHRRDALMAAELHAATMERVALQRRTLEAGLKIMQSRIDPAFLLDTLTDVSKRCEQDAASAERIVDQLVLYLRGTLPDVGEEGTTLSREVNVAASYLELVALRSGRRVRFTIALPDQVMDIRMAPMVLMPLLARIMSGVPNAVAGIATRTAGRSRSENSGSTMVRIEASIVEPTVQVTISCTDSSPAITPDDPLLREVRARLAALYGASASLRLDTEGTHASATLALPREPVIRVETDRRTDAMQLA